MIKKLKRKFICMMMSIVFVMLGIIIGLILHFTGLAIESQSLQMMQSIGTSPFFFEQFSHREDDDSFPFFTVQINRNREMEIAGNGFPDEEAIPAILEQALASKTHTGVLPDYAVRYLKTKTPVGDRVVFADITAEKTAMAKLAWRCAAVGLGSLLAFFCLSIFLARLAVKPVEQAWEQQKQFVADASHELKTPLTVIMTNAELLEYPDYDAATKAQFVTGILSMSHKMHGLVNSMLELARIDNGSVGDSMERLNLSSLIESEIPPYEALFFEKNRDLTLSVPPDVFVFGSDKHLRQLLGVLLDNAVKYVEAPGGISVSLTQHAGHCRIAVANPGEQIAKEDLQNIFKRFYRGDKVRGASGSYGLGLSIAQGIVEIHKGKIWAESENGINTFFVQLPTV